MDECINYAIEHNNGVKQSQYSVEQSAIELNTAKNSVWPSLQANGSQSLNFGRGLTEDNIYTKNNTANTSFSIGGSLDLFTGLRVKNNITMGKLNLQAATADYEKAKDDIRIAVMQAYIQILFDMEISKVAAEQVSIDSMQVERLSAMEKAGKVGPAEVAAQKSALAQSRLTCTQAANQLNLDLLSLSQLLELNSPEGFSVIPMDVSNFTVNALPDPEQVYAQAIGVRPSIKAEEIRYDYAKANIALAKSGYIPTLSMNGGIGTNYYALLGYQNKKFGQQLKDNFSPYLGFNLNIPLFDKLVTRNNVRSAKLQLSSQQLQLDNAKKKLYKEIQQAYYGAVAARDKYNSSKAAAESAQEAFTLESARYENGKSTFTEFNESKNNYLKATSDLLQAQYDYIYKVQLLEFYRSGE
jgi:outer membrane protein